MSVREPEEPRGDIWTYLHSLLQGAAQFAARGFRIGTTRIYQDVTGNLYQRKSDGTETDLAQATGGSGSMTTVKEAGVQVGGADIVTLDFGAGFDLTESPDTEINIALDLTEVSDFTAHKTRHQDAGADEISVTGLSGLLADDQHVLDAEVDARISALAVEHADITPAEGFLRKTGAGAYTAHKSNLGTGNVDPTVNDDETAGYSIGSIWTTTTSGKVFRCVKATAGGAVWRLLYHDLVTIGADAEHSLATQVLSGVAASLTQVGHVELATAAETTTGTDATRGVTPDGLAGSDYGKRVVGILVSDPGGDAITTGDGKAYFRVPSVMNTYNLVAVAASLSTVSSSGIPTVQIRRSRWASATTRTNADMLSTKLTIDASEFDSIDAAAAAVIDTANDDVNTGDHIYIDIDVAGTGAKGLFVEMHFQLP